MSSTDKQGSSLDSFPTSPPLYPHFNRPSGFWPCVKSCLVGGSDKYLARSWRSSLIVRTALTRQSLRSRPIRPHAFDPTKPSFPSDSSARLWHGKAFAPVRYIRTAKGPSKALAFPRPQRSCKVQRSPRNDSLLRTVLPLQHLTHVRPAVRASNRIDTPLVNHNIPS